MLLGVNMQTSFMHPPFGFALFYLRSVAPVKDYLDKVTGKITAKVTTGQIYWGAVPFVVIQVIMVAIVIAFPGIVTSGLDKKIIIDTDKVQIEVPLEAPTMDGDPGAASGDPAKDDDDPAKAIERAMRGDAKK